MSCRSLSLARVVDVIPPPSAAPSHFATAMIVEVRVEIGTDVTAISGSASGQPWLRIGGPDGDVLWSACDCSDRWWTTRLGGASLLAEVYSGRTGVSEVCDANPYLLRAAKFHGKPSQVMCPICRKEQLTLVSWVFGEHLGAVSGSARTAEELVLLATRFEEFAVHVVEVCRTCSWNHLVKSYVLGAARPPKGDARHPDGAQRRPHGH